jgi:hypothetical protein
MALILDFYKENSLASLELSVLDPVYYVEEHGSCQNCFTKQFHKKYSNLIKLFLLIYIVLKGEDQFVQCRIFRTTWSHLEEIYMMVVKIMLLLLAT